MSGVRTLHVCSSALKSSRTTLPSFFACNGISCLVAVNEVTAILTFDDTASASYGVVSAPEFDTVDDKYS